MHKNPGCSVSRFVLTLPSLDKGRHGFDGQKCAAPASDGFSCDFWFLRRRLAGASQGEKGKKRRKDMLAGVFALAKRWYYEW